MSGWIRALLALMAALWVAQWAGVWAIDRWLAAQLVGRIGVVPRVSVAAVPFWKLAQGRFDQLTVTAQGGQVDGLRFRSGQLWWRQGAVDPAALWLDHRLVVRRVGKVEVSLTVGEGALTDWLGRITGGQLEDPEVRIKPDAVVVSGVLRVHGATVPVTTSGTMVVAADGQSIAYQPRTFDGLAIPVLTRLTVLSLRQLPVPVPLAVQSLRLSRGALTVVAHSRSAASGGVHAAQAAG